MWWYPLSKATTHFVTEKANRHLPGEGRAFLLICEGIIQLSSKLNCDRNAYCNVTVHSIRSLVKCVQRWAFARQVGLLQYRHTSSSLHVLLAEVFHWEYVENRYNWGQGRKDSKYRVPREHVSISHMQMCGGVRLRNCQGPTVFCFACILLFAIYLQFNICYGFFHNTIRRAILRPKWK